MEAAVEQRDVKFFDAHIEEFKASGYKLHAPVVNTIFYLKYSRFLAEQLTAAMKENNQERIRLLLAYMPQHGAVLSMDSKTGILMKGLGDYLFYEQKDEALAIAFLKLKYPLNRIDCSRAKFSSDFIKTLTADSVYAIDAFELDKWHGPLAQQETVFLVGLSDNMLKKVDPRYIDDTVKLCLSKNKNELALKLIHAKSLAHPLTAEDQENMLDWAIQTGNNEFFKHVLTQNKDMDINTIKLVQLAQNDKMFMKYAPGIITYINRNEKAPTYEGPTLGDSIREVVLSTNQFAGAYLIKKYNLLDNWNRPPSDPTLLMEVCLAGNLTAAKYLIETKRQDPLKKTRYSKKEISLFGQGRALEGNLNLVHMAAKSGNSELIKYLASKKVSVNAQTYFGVTPLMYAVSGGHLDATKMLLLLRANVNKTMNSSLQGEPMPESGSYTQLSSAYRRAEHGKLDEILALLKKAGARP